MSKKLITHAKGETIDNIVDSILEELFDEENKWVCDELSKQQESTEYWKSESSLTGELIALYKIIKSENFETGYIYQHGKWDEDIYIADRIAKDDHYKCISEAEAIQLTSIIERKEEYIRKLGTKTGRQLNAIISLVHQRIPKDQIVFKDEIEEQFFDSLEKEASAVKERYGHFPEFELFEID